MIVVHGAVEEVVGVLAEVHEADNFHTRACMVRLSDDRNASGCTHVDVPWNTSDTLLCAWPGSRQSPLGLSHRL